MKKVIAKNCIKIPIGRVGENETTQIIWVNRAAELRALYGDGTVQLAARRPGDAAPYPAVVTISGDDIIWTVGAADLAREGTGNCELTWIIGDAVAKSQTWDTIISPSLTSTEPTDPPEPEQNWVNKVLEAGASAAESADNAQKAQTKAETASEDAQTAKTAAETAQEKAEAAQAAIEGMEVAAETKAPGEDATVTKTMDGDVVKLTFGIPKGEKGEKGDAPDVSAAIKEHNESKTAHPDIRNTISTHTKSTTVHLTDAERKAWNKSVLLGEELVQIPYPIASWGGITYGGGKFVAIPSGNMANAGTDHAAYSEDGITWIGSTLPSAQKWNGVCYGNGIFVAIPESGTAAAYSDDGTVWAKITLPASITASSDIAYGNEVFVIVDASIGALYSSDGINWTQASTSGAFSKICFGADKFFAHGSSGARAAYSNNGKDWKTITLLEDGDWGKPIYGADKYIVFSGNKILYSRNCITWAKAILPVNGGRWVTAYSGKKFVALAPNKNVAIYSDDGVTWAQSTLPYSWAWASVAYGAGRFAALANTTYSQNTVTISIDGINWAVSNPVLNDVSGNDVSGRVKEALSSILEDANAYTDSKTLPTPAVDQTFQIPVAEKGIWGYKMGWLPFAVGIQKSGDTYSCDYTAGELSSKFFEGYIPFLFFFSFTEDWDRVSNLYQYAGYSEQLGGAVFFASYAAMGMTATDMAVVDANKNITFTQCAAMGGTFFVEASDTDKTANMSASEIYSMYEAGFIPVLKYDACLYHAVTVTNGYVMFAGTYGADEGEGPQLQTNVIMIDDSKAVTDLNGTYGLLPQVTAADSGKFLRVSSSGSWAAESIPDASEVTF